MSSFAKEIAVSVDLAMQAVSGTERIRREGVEAIRKDDGTPVTQADIVSQAVILAGLRAHFPRDRVLAEEQMSHVQGPGLGNRARKVLAELGLQDLGAHLDEAVNYRGNPRGSRIWMVDPIDGTKGFKRGLSYAICIGLYFRGRPQFGCMAVAFFPWPAQRERTTLVAYAGKGIGAYVLTGRAEKPKRIHVSQVSRMMDLTVVGSRAHDRADLCAKFMEKAGARRRIQMDGAAKYLMLATGQADVYLRAADPAFGIAFSWDHCAGQVILEESGGVVTTFAGDPIHYAEREGEAIRDLEGLVASNGRCHDTVLGLLREML